MGRPTLASQISKAAADGDMEKVKELAIRLEKSENKKQKPKSKNRNKTTSEVEVYEEEVYENDRVYNDFIAPSKSNKKRETPCDGDGHVHARVVPFKIIKNRKNQWEDDIQQEAADIEFDKLVHKNKKNKKHRSPINKIKVKCNRCERIKTVWPGEVLHKNWACDECLVKNRPEA